MARAYPAYVTSFEEWFAENFNKFVANDLNTAIKDPELRNFWQKLYDTLKHFYEHVIKPAEPNSTFLSYINALEAKNVKPPAAAAVTAVQKDFVERLEKLVGKRVRVKFNEVLDGTAVGEYTDLRAKVKKLGDERRGLLNANATKNALAIKALEEQIAKIQSDLGVLGLLRIATGAESNAGLVEHEAFHAAMSFFFSPEEKRILATAFTQGLVSKRLREYFKDSPEVLAAIDPKSEKYDPEEAAAYGFQVWSLNPEVLQMGEKAKTLFERFQEFIRGVLGLLTNEEKALLIMNDLASGRRADKGISPLARKLDVNRPWTERAQEMLADLGGVVKGFHDVLLTGVYERMQDTKNPWIAKIARLGYQNTGAEGGAGMVQRMIHQNTLFQNRIDGVFRGLSEDQLKQLHAAKIKAERPTDAALASAYDKVTDLYKDMYTYQKDAGVDVGHLDNYYPLSWSAEKVANDRDGFIAMLKTYQKELNTLMKTPEEIWQSISAYIERGEKFVNVMGSENEPIAEHSNDRTLDFISREDRMAFMEEDPLATVVRYAKQAVRQTEFVRSFGKGGAKLSAMKAKAVSEYGATPDEMKLVSDYLDGLLGNKEVGMNRQLKDLYGAMTVYQNIRLLPFSLFASLVDPLGIAVRSNSVGDAWGAFTYSLKNIFRDWREDYTPDQWELMAQDMGTITRAGTIVNADNLYTGVTLRGTTRKINDGFFKYNLLNGWIRNNTIMATKSAHLFMLRAANGKMWTAAQNERYLTELGVSADQVIEDSANEGILWRESDLKQHYVSEGMKEEQASLKAKEAATNIRNATEMFVRQALLNPSAAELPNWASNPYLLPIAHLKKFVWAFQSTITDRVKLEAQNENYQPMLVAALYVPGMIAATFLKDFVSNMGDEPPYKKDWGVVDYVKDGVLRSGLTGTGQFFTDVNADLMHGGEGWESLAGPSISQLKQGLKAASDGNPAALQKFIVKSLPANAVYDQWLTNY